jgi:uncharacterized membrane protein
MAYKFNDGSTNAYVGAGYYPMLISAILTIFSITGILTDLFSKEKNTKKVDLKNIKNVGLITAAAIIIVSFWQFFNLFYPAAFVSLCLLLIFLSEKMKNRKNIIVSLVTALVFVILAYIIFDILLKFNHYRLKPVDWQSGLKPPDIAAKAA